MSCWRSEGSLGAGERTADRSGADRYDDRSIELRMFARLGPSARSTRRRNRVCAYIYIYIYYYIYIHVYTLNNILIYTYTHTHATAYVRDMRLDRVYRKSSDLDCHHLPYGSSSRQSIRSECPVGFFFVPITSEPRCSSSMSRPTHCPVVS